jgi:hypothetical protein
MNYTPQHDEPMFESWLEKVFVFSIWHASNKLHLDDEKHVLYIYAAYLSLDMKLGFDTLKWDYFCKYDMRQKVLLNLFSNWII